MITDAEVLHVKCKILVQCIIYNKDENKIDRKATTKLEQGVERRKIRSCECFNAIGPTCRGLKPTVNS